MTFLDDPPRVLQQVEIEKILVFKDEHRSYPVWCEHCRKVHYMKDFDIIVQFCIAHLIREIKYLAGLPDAETRVYGKKLLAAIKAMFKIIHDRDSLGDEAFGQAMEQARLTIMKVAIENVPSRLNAKGKE